MYTYESARSDSGQWLSQILCGSLNVKNSCGYNWEHGVAEK